MASNCENSAVFVGFRRVFPIFFFAAVGGSIELGAFDKVFYRIARSILFQAQREFSTEFEDVARLIAANLVLLVIVLLKMMCPCFLPR